MWPLVGNETDGMCLLGDSGTDTDAVGSVTDPITGAACAIVCTEDDANWVEREDAD